MQREPDRIGVRARPDDPMAAMSPDQQVVAGGQPSRRILILEVKFGSSTQDGHPFVLNLIEPEAIG